MRLKIGGRKGYVTRSTKLTIYEDAYEYAKSELLRLQQAATQFRRIYVRTALAELVRTKRKERHVDGE